MVIERLASQVLPKMCLAQHGGHGEGPRQSAVTILKRVQRHELQVGNPRLEHGIQRKAVIEPRFVC